MARILLVSWRATIRVMFELQRLLSAGSPRIVLQTRRGRNIDNQIAPDVAEQHRRRYAALLQKFGGNWRQRKPAHGGYNCAGHVWASRRTSIYEEGEWRKILEDDGYRKTQRPEVDDIVIYVDSKYGMLHMGRVVELREGVTSASPKLPWVVSKWSDWSGEVVHMVADVPFPAQGFAVATEYWTDRPLPD